MKNGQLVDELSPYFLYWKLEVLPFGEYKDSSKQDRRKMWESWGTQRKPKPALYRDVELTKDLPQKEFKKLVMLLSLGEK